MIKKWVSIFCLIFMMVTTVVWAKPNSAYVDNGNGTVTDIETKLMWQQETVCLRMRWMAAMWYCQDLSLAGYTDWRLPTLHELKTLVDRTPDGPPKINTTYFPKTVSDFYWSSTTVTIIAEDTDWARNVNFYNGSDRSFLNKSKSYYIRAVRGRQTGSSSNLDISPLSRMVTKDAGITTITVSNTGTGTMPWTAAVTSGDSWLSISNYDAETITCSFTANTSSSQARTATIQMTTATGATENLIELKVTQCAASTLSDDFKIHISDFLVPDGITHLWMDMEYSQALSTDENVYFEVKKFGIVSN